MRKSERLRMLEMQVLRLEFELDLTKTMISALLEANNIPGPDLDAGKWYRRKVEGRD